MTKTTATLNYKEFICGWSAGCIETCILYPQTKLIFRQTRYNIVIGDAYRQIKREGIRQLYRGLLPPLIQRTTARSIMFGTNEKYQRLFNCQDKGPSLCHAGCSFLAGATEAILSPFERVQALLQTREHQNRMKNTGQAFLLVYREYSPREFYRGVSVVIMRNGLSNIMFFSLRQPLRQLVLDTFPQQKDTRTKHAIANFFSGGLLGGCISTVVFPLNVVKARMQSIIGLEFCSPWRILRKIWKEREGSILKLYRGVSLNFTRSVMTWGLTNTLYEFLLREFFGESRNY